MLRSPINRSKKNRLSYNPSAFITGLIICALSATTPAASANNSTVLASVALERTANVTSDTAALKADSAAVNSNVIPVQIMTTIKPLALMLQALLPEQQTHWQLSVLVPAEGSVHDFSPTPSDVARMQKADMIFWLGANAEPGFERMMTRFKLNHAPLSASSIRWRTLEEEDVTLGSNGHGHDHGTVDPHIWLSLPQAPIMFEYMAKTLIQLIDTPEMRQKLQWSDEQVRQQQQAIQTRLVEFRRDHQSIESRLAALRKTWTQQFYISFHDAFGYLDQAADIKSLGAFVQNPEDGISPRQIRELQDVMENQELGCLFSEPYADGRDIESFIVNNLPVVDLDINANTLPSGLDWFGFWAYMLEQLQTCFGSPMPEQDVPARTIEPPLRPIEKDEDRILEKLKQF